MGSTLAAPSTDDAQTTVEGKASTTSEGSDAVVGLTILFHPDPNRVGEVAELFSLRAGGRRRLGRHEPVFRAPRDHGGRPLATPVVSRITAQLFVNKQGEVVIRNCEAARVRALGIEVDASGSYVVPRARIEAGVLLELNRTVLLLLHPVDDFRSAPASLTFVGDSIQLNRLRREILRVADLDTSVLLLGESGSGKELAAKAIHQNSKRSHMDLVAVNLGALPHELAAAALFGHKKGAFTGATAARPGYFSAANGGTLFLDEVGELPLNVQPLLLRALREKEVQPLGASRTEHVDIRIIAATDSNLELRAETGSFSSPLLHRLRGYTVRVPPLRERRDDIARLFFHFLRLELAGTGELHRLQHPAPHQKPWLPMSVLRQVVSHPWPGNAAALQNFARQLCIANRFEPRFVLHEAAANTLNQASTGDAATASTSGEFGRDEKPRRSRSDAGNLSDQQILLALARNDYNITRSALDLGVSQSWLNTRMDSCKGIVKAQTLAAADILTAASSCNDLVSLARELRVSEHGLKLRMRVLKNEGQLADLAWLDARP